MIIDEVHLRETTQPAGSRVRLVRAWVGLCLALALHVTDEAVTGFLSVHNPTVMALRAKWPWLPLPGFRFEVWLATLTLGTIFGQTVARVRVPRPLPGF